ncbi:MAG: hypothetical protein GC155_01530 [Alphaproteobacteria bacterium]|nr:hypothetical protein [Alphaproteobacteria bacterium]
MSRKLWIALTGLVLAGCVTPSYTKKVTTLGQVDMTGLECRRVQPIDSHAQRTMCATPASWAKYDRKQIAASEEFFAATRNLPNVDKFNRLP